MAAHGSFLQSGLQPQMVLTTGQDAEVFHVVSTRMFACSKMCSSECGQATLCKQKQKGKEKEKNETLKKIVFSAEVKHLSNLFTLLTRKTLQYTEIC